MRDVRVRYQPERRLGILNVELVLKVCSEGRLEERGILNARAHRRVRLNLER